jgi:hypothetical protein
MSNDRVALKPTAGFGRFAELLLVKRTQGVARFGKKLNRLLYTFVPAFAFPAGKTSVTPEEFAALVSIKALVEPEKPGCRNMTCVPFS